ncbi:MAG: hypothetical protein A3I29_01715 [Candidatus Magasanikbacteria bacterium RIFCSPLOWO2_02_FULL_44_11]|uniref:Uncharacterized protein n=1 Tax=Candidatus Magasanikbacteria bacterium RIFCSPLOWO2_02_FULL_44_11 TaxID=1798689 RepID=A0A1F6NB56_9BACT|nr:MAG: hypothetical protein A3I29_01715 [Candidatus Magasanikbacteria bacterium RIFCSPLOWO2_02_FULL_44_11]
MLNGINIRSQECYFIFLKIIKIVSNTLALFFQRADFKLPFLFHDFAQLAFSSFLYFRQFGIGKMYFVHNFGDSIVNEIFFQIFIGAIARS